MSSPAASNSSRRVILRRNGRRHELLASQVTTENLRRMFQVDVSEVWLRDNVTDDAFFPELDGGFLIADIADYSVLNVEGPESTSLSSDSPLPRRPSQRSGSSMTTSSTIAPSPAPPSFRSVCPPGTKKTASFALKIIKAKVHKKNKKKLDFEVQSATHFDITDSTANVACILDCVKRKWGEDYVIVTSDGIEIEDSPSTQGKSRFTLYYNYIK